MIRWHDIKGENSQKRGTNNEKKKNNDDDDDADNDDDDELIYIKEKRINYKANTVVIGGKIKTILNSGLWREVKNDE